MIFTAKNMREVHGNVVYDILVNNQKVTEMEFELNVYQSFPKHAIKDFIKGRILDELKVVVDNGN